MDPVGPWSAYPYNRLPGVQTGSSGSDLHHHLTASSATGAPPATTASILSGGFLSPPSVAYEAVFSPLFHTKQSHYVAQHRQALAQAATKQSTDGEYQTQFFEQGTNAWQQGGPFGILPHESVPPTSKSNVYENFNAHFAAAQSLNHLSKTSSTRAQSPQVTSTSASKVTSSPTFYQVPNTFSGTDNKPTFSTTSSSNLQQSCIVSSATNAITSKEYRVPQSPSSRSFMSSNTRNNTEQTPQIQTKAQTKIYPELSNQIERQRNLEKSQSSPVSFTMEQNRMNYNAGKRNFQHSNYNRHYQQQGGANESDFQRPKSGSDYNNSAPDCNVVVPRRPSPLQAHSQASPIGHAQSPAYPMYNSPMNSISSPQQQNATPNNQITPSSPLDVSVPRPNAQNNVAYPSVITRALNSQNQQQNCWDERSQGNNRKFQSNQNGNYNGMEITRVDPSQRPIDRQQTYFDTGHQVTLQDLSSCRGDPMSIVKNLQQCQVQTEIKQEPKTPIKRRKSNEKAVGSGNDSSSMDYFASRVPPPAHSTGTNQQQPNGAYFDFDRWNLPPPAKMFNSQTIHQQHQSLMVPHPHPHHPPPPLPYFPTFHIPTHPPEFTNEVAMPSTYNEQPSAGQFQPVEDQPKVVVPNIEEELNFLSGSNYRTRPPNPSNVQQSHQQHQQQDKKTNGPGAGFMNSYLKFLQGERDNSPPPSTRGGRRQAWTNVKPKVETTKPDSVNGVTSTTTVNQSPTIITTTPQPPKRLTKSGDPQDDPRYFPLPKERKSNTFESSDDGVSSEDDLFNKKLPSTNKESNKDKSARKGRPCKPGGPTERKRARQAAALIKQQNQEETNEAPLEKEPIQRREPSKRAAKEKINMKQTDDDAEEPPEFADSDSDPAWTPLAKEDVDEDPPKKTKRGRTGGRNKTRASRNIISSAVKSAGIQETDGYISDSSQSKRSKSNNKSSSKSVTNSYNETPSTQKQSSTFENPFKPGEFIAIKSDLHEVWPAIWRVDGRTLLQKYEPFEKDGSTFYRNISTYTSWTPECKKQYITIPVRFVSQHPLETIVEFLKDELNIMDPEFLEKFMKDNAAYQDNFEVYIQTLISQALDSNFLTEIFQEKDDYFLSNVKIIDDITDNKKQMLINILRWPQTVQTAVSTWPCFNIINELGNDTRMRLCIACNQTNASVRVLMYGQPYNATTLDGCQPDPQTADKKDFYMCQVCVSRVELFNKITHQKYLMYIECAKRVAEKRQQDLSKDTTFILNELLADEQWLIQLFTEVRTIWAEVDNLERKYFNKVPTGVQ